MTETTEKQEFDEYASAGYEDSLKDPLKESFGSELEYFLQIKADVFRDIIQKYNLKSDSKLLDLGCGNGKFTQMIEGHFALSLGSDISLGMLKHNEFSDLCVADGLSLPFKNESFDCITAVCIFHHILPEDRVQAMKEIHRILKPGGLFFMFEHNPLNPLTRWIVKRSPVDVNAVLLGTNEAARLLGKFSEINKQFFLFYPEKLKFVLGWSEKLLGWCPLGGQYVTYGRK